MHKKAGLKALTHAILPRFKQMALGYWMLKCNNVPICKQTVIEPLPGPTIALTINIMSHVC